MALGKGIPVINGFDLNSKLPLDSRAVADTMEEMNALVTGGSVGDGQLCYCKADKKLYVLKDGIWSEVGGGGGIPVVEGTESTTTTDGAYVTYTIPEAQTSCFIFKCDLGIAFVSYNVAFGTYNGYLDAEGSVTDGSLKLNDLIVLSGSGTTIDIFFGNIGGSGLPIVQATLSGTTGEIKTYTIPEKQTSPFILSIDGNYVLTSVSASGDDYYGEYYYQYKYYYISGGGTSILLRENTSFVIESKLVLEYGYIETGGFPQDDTTSVSASFRVNIDVLEYISMETIIVYANGEDNPVMFNVAKDSLGHKYNSVCFNDDNSIYFYYLTEFELTSVSDNKYSVAFKVRRKTIPAPTTTITFED